MTSKQVKILNIEPLLTNKENPVVVIDKNPYPITEMSVGDFITLSDLNEAFFALENPTNTQQVNFLVSSVLIGIPTCSRETLLSKCSIKQLSDIAAFIKDGSVPDNVTGISDPADGRAKKSRAA